MLLKITNYLFCFSQDCSKDDSSTDEVNNANPKELNKNPHRRYKDQNIELKFI